MKNLAFLLSIVSGLAADIDQVTWHRPERNAGNPHVRATVLAAPRFLDAADQRKAPLPNGHVERGSVARAVPAVPLKKIGTNGDAFLFMAIYWGVVATLFAIWLCLAYYKEKTDRVTESPVADVAFAFFRSKSRSDMSPSKSEHPLQTTDTLAVNMWSLNLVAAIGQAKYPSGRTIHPLLVLLVSLIMALLQVFALFLVVDSVDPAASPITAVPTTPWKTAQHAWTVNSMKWVMVTFLAMSVVSEAGDAQKVFANAYMIEKDRLRTWRWIPLSTSILHYVINIGVVIVGVSVILCCQDVPSILYNSLAITFINRFDETTHDFVEKVCGIECEFEIAHNAWDAPAWLEVFERFFVLLPFLWAFFLIGRAWCTNQMPSAVLAWVLAAVGKVVGRGIGV